MSETGGETTTARRSPASAAAIAGGGDRVAADGGAPSVRSASIHQQPTTGQGTRSRTRRSWPIRSMAARCPICAGAQRQSQRDRNPALKLGEGCQARRHPGRILRLRLPLLQGQQPAHRPPGEGRSGPARGLSRVPDPRVRKRGRGTALPASKRGKFLQFHDTLWEAGRPSPETIGIAARAAGITSAPPGDPAVDAEF